MATLILAAVACAIAYVAVKLVGVLKVQDPAYTVLVALILIVLIIVLLGLIGVGLDVPRLRS